MATARDPDRDHRSYLRGDREHQLRASRDRAVSPLLLWLGILGGPLAFALVRIAGIVLVSAGCGSATSSSGILGLSSSQDLVAAITVVGALIAAAAGLLAWRLWRQTGSPEEETSVGSVGNSPFWALGGLFLSGVFLVAIIINGGIALAVSTSCSM